MKKNYLFLAAATTLFAACVQTDVVTDIPEPQQQAISFETFANKATRAGATPAATTALATHHDAYKVWAYKNTQNSTLVFNAEVVTAANNEYSTTQYWDKAATNYYFYAAAPALAVVQNGLTFTESTTGEGESVTTIQDAAHFKYTNLTLSGSNFSNLTTLSTSPQSTFIKKDNNTQTITDTDVDYMIAKTPVTRSNGTYTNPVNFDFKHILSRLNIKINAAANAPEIKLTNLSLHGLKNQATFNSSTETFTSRWTSASTNPYNGYKVSSDAGITVSATDANYILESLLIPQVVEYEKVEMDGTIITQTTTKDESGADVTTTTTSTNKTKAYIYIQYKINDEIFDAYYNLAALFGATLDNNQTNDKKENEVTFSEAHQSTLNITFSPQGITFSTTTTGWEAENASQDDLTIQ